MPERDFRTTGGSDFDFYVFVLAGMITQISGMIAQAKMDDKVMMIAADTIAREAYRNTNNNTAAPAGGKFCTQCGKSMPAEALFCSGCGAKL